MANPQHKADAALNGLSGLDKLLEHRSRLGRVRTARRRRRNFFQQSARTARRNGTAISAPHLRKLEEAGYVKRTQRVSGPQTSPPGTPLGGQRARRALKAPPGGDAIRNPRHETSKSLLQNW